jgi:hypothetical protein
MAFEFEFIGGVAKPSFHDNVKHLLFVIVGGYEVPFYQLRQDGLVMQVAEGEHRFRMNHNIVKVFTGCQGFQQAKRYFSFYFALQEGAVPEVTILPFPGTGATDFKFKARGRFLTKNQALKVLAEDADSRPFLKRQVMLPLDTLRRMVIVDRTVMRAGMRHVRIGKPTKGEML